MLAAMLDITGLLDERVIDLKSKCCDFVQRQFFGYPEVTFQAPPNLVKFVPFITYDVEGPRGCLVSVLGSQLDPILFTSDMVLEALRHLDSNGKLVAAPY